MKLSVSNIAWSEYADEEMLSLLMEMGFSGLEIAPSRIISSEPYDHKKEGKEFSYYIKKTFGLEISSMQSIWYGKGEQMFHSDEEHHSLLAYTKKAIEFAEAVGCSNLVFGCPKNRVSYSEQDVETAIAFFGELGDYAHTHNTCLSLEANPVIYNTNFITTTKEAVDLINLVSSNGFKLNLDLGTMVYNQESLDTIRNSLPLVNHIHISEPHLLPIIPRNIHKELAEMLKEKKYDKFVSIEMGKTDSLQDIITVMRYVKEIFS